MNLCWYRVIQERIMMRFAVRTSRFLPLFILLIALISRVQAQEPSMSIDTRGIILGNDWNHETRELATVFSDQSVLDLGESGIRSVQIWTDIRNGAGKQITWVVEYGNGMRQEVWTQHIRYDRFRTYLKKTFRRNILDTATKQLVNVAGPCTIKLIDKQDNNRVIAARSILLK